MVAVAFQVRPGRRLQKPKKNQKKTNKRTNRKKTKERSQKKNKNPRRVLTGWPSFTFDSARLKETATKKTTKTNKNKKTKEGRARFGVPAVSIRFVLLLFFALFFFFGGVGQGWHDGGIR